MAGWPLAWRSRSVASLCAHQVHLGGQDAAGNGQAPALAATGVGVVTSTKPPAHPLVEGLRELIAQTIHDVLEAQDPDPWIDTRSDRCPVGHQHILAAARTGQIDAFRVGRKTLVRRSALDAWIQRAEHREKSLLEAAPAPKSVEHILSSHGYAPTVRTDGSSATLEDERELDEMRAKVGIKKKLPPGV